MRKSGWGLEEGAVPAGSISPDGPLYVNLAGLLRSHRPNDKACFAYWAMPRLCVGHALTIIVIVISGSNWWILAPAQASGLFPLPMSFLP